MDWPYIDDHCANCGIKCSSSTQIFHTITVTDEINCFKTQAMQDIQIVDAILYIYGLSVTNLASACLENENDSIANYSSPHLSETSDYIKKQGLALCSNCASVFKKIYVAVQQFKELSDKTTILTKAIKKFSPTQIKTEVGPYERKLSLSNSDNQPNNELEKEKSNDLFQEFNCDQDIYGENYDQEDVKPALVSSCGLLSDSHAKFNNCTAKLEDTCKSSPRQCSGGPKKRFTQNKKTKRTREKVYSNQRHLRNKYPPKALSGSIAKPERIYPSRRTTSLLSKNYCALEREVVPETLTVEASEATGRFKMEPIIKLDRIDIEERKEKGSRLNLKSTKRRQQISSGRKYRWSRKKKYNNFEKVSQARNDKEFVDENSENDLDSLYENGANENTTSSEEMALPLSSSILKKLKHTDKALKCSCGVAYHTLESLRVHEKSATHEQPPVMCDKCGKTFKKNYLLYGHLSKEHFEIPHIVFKCDLCDAKYLSQTGLKVHKEQNHTSNPKSFVCDKCGKAFNCLRYMKRHSVIVHKDEDLDKELFKCKECGVALKHSDGLKKHMRVMHGPQKIFTCPQCGKTTKSTTNMKIHMKVHDPNRSIKQAVPSFTASI